MEKEILSQLGKKASPSKKSELENLSMQEVIARYQKGESLQDILHIGNEVLEILYYSAYQYYEKEDFTTAVEIFRILCGINPSEYKYLYGMASSLLGLKAYDLAYLMFITAYQQSDHKNDALLYALQCLIDMEAYAEAKEFALQVIEEAKKYHQQQVLNKSLLYIDLIETKLQ